MSDEKRIDETPEFVEPELDYEKMMKEMEEDEKIRSFEIPEEWDREFRKIIDESYKKEQRERMRRSLKSMAKAASIVLVGGALLLHEPVTAQGASFLEVLQSFFGIGEKNFVIFGTDREETVLPEVEQNEIVFDTESLESVYEQTEQELSSPLFYISYVPEGYMLTEARYDKMFKILTIKLEKDEKVIYITQQNVLREDAAGVVMNKEASAAVENNNLKQEISIFQSEQDDSLAFSIKNSYGTLSFTGMVSLEECKKVAQAIYCK